MRLNVEFSDGLRTDALKVSALAGLTLSAFVRQAMRAQIARYRQAHPTVFNEQTLTPFEDLALEAIEEGNCEFEHVRQYCRMTEGEALGVLDSLVRKKRIEKRKRANGDHAKGKQPEIWVKI